MSEFKVGDFKTGSNTAPRKKAAQTERTVAATTAAAEDDVATETPPPPKTTAELYRDRLAAAGIDEEEANNIFDDVLAKGYYQETYKIRGRPVVFRTRTYEDHIRALGAIEINSPKFQLTQEELQARHNLAASLVEWNGVSYKTGKDPDREFLTAMEAIRRLPAPIYTMLIAELVRFDAKMFVVFSEGAAESF